MTYIYKVWDQGRDRRKTIYTLYYYKTYRKEDKKTISVVVLFSSFFHALLQVLMCTCISNIWIHMYVRLHVYGTIFLIYTHRKSLLLSLTMPFHHVLNILFGLVLTMYYNALLHRSNLQLRATKYKKILRQ